MRASEDKVKRKFESKILGDLIGRGVGFFQSRFLLDKLAEFEGRHDAADSDTQHNQSSHGGAG